METPAPVLDYCRIQDLELHTFASLEAQVAAVSDDIAYNSADLDDALRAGLFGLDDLAEVPVVNEILASLRMDHPTAKDSRVRSTLVSALITGMVEDVITQSRRNLRELRLDTVDDVRHAAQTVVSFSPELKRKLDGLRGFLFRNMYRHPSVMRVMRQAEMLVTALFEIYADRPLEMAAGWQDLLIRADKRQLMRQVCDYLSGMTDDFAIREGRRLLEPETFARFDAFPDLL